MHELRMSPDAQQRAVAMNFRQAWLSLALLAPILLALVVIFLIQDVWLGVGYGALVVVLLGASVPLSVALAKWAMRETYVRFGDGWIEHRWMFRTRRFQAAEATSVVTVDSMSFGGLAMAPTHHLIVTGRDRRLLLLVGQMWSTQQLSAVMQDLAARGVPWFPVPGTVTPPQLRARDTRLVPWWQAHPVGFALLLAAGVLVVLAIVLVVVAFIVFIVTTR